MLENTSSPTRDIIIVGAGIAGLTAALHLAERGHRPLVLEADSLAGGRLKGGPPIVLEHAGKQWEFPGEHGVHALWSPYRNLQALLGRLGIRPVLVPARQEAWIHGEGRTVRRTEIGSAIRSSWIPAPFHYLGLFARPRFFRMLGLRGMVTLPRVFGALLGTLSIDPLDENQPLKGWMLSEFTRQWTPTLIGFFTGFTRNAIPGRLEEIPAASFIAFMRFYTLRRRDAWAFSYLPTAAGAALIDPWVAALRRHGGELRLNARVVRLEQSAEGWQVTWREGETERTARTARVILALDAPGADALLRTSPATADHARTLDLPEGKPTAVLRFWFDRAPQERGAEAGIFSGNFVLDNFFWLHRIYDEYARWARATGGSAIEAHIYGPPEFLEKPDAALLAQAQIDILRAWPELKGHGLRAVLTRNPPTHTLLKIGLPDEHPGVVTAWPGLYACGDWVRAPASALFLERACVTGIMAANAVLEARGEPTWPILQPLPPEPLAAAIERGWRALRRRLRRQRKNTSRP